MRLKLIGEAIFQPGRIVGTVAGKSVVLGGRSALSAIAIAENILWQTLRHGDTISEVKIVVWQTPVLKIPSSSKASKHLLLGPKL